MGDTLQLSDFAVKFSRLSEQNQRYVIAIQQALMYAQENEKEAEKKWCEREDESERKVGFWNEQGEVF